MKLCDLHIAPVLQPRGKQLCADTVAEYTAAAKAGAQFPKLLAYRVTDRKFPGPVLVAGFHRHKALTAAGVGEWEVELREGTFAEAWLAGWTSNLTNGLRYSNEEKRHAVETALKLYKDSSANAVAEMMKVSHTFVLKVRKEMVEAGAIQEPTKVKTTDGRTRPASNSINSGSRGIETVSIPPKSDDATSTPNTAADNNIQPEASAVNARGSFPFGANATPEPVNLSQPDGDSDEQANTDARADSGEPPADETPRQRNERVGAELVKQVESYCRELDAMAAKLESFDTPPAYAIDKPTAISQLKAVRKQLWIRRPNYTCPYCKGDGCERVCRGSGRVNQGTYDRGVAAVGAPE